ncbi:hypothetical protein GALL_291390 [mine drainage metagenome]|uniref:HPt domain-containing protein n=1 Tax=mine drainage metagenome TaxID=410659 RepID=A0A1J5QZB1_9ZZZZ
MQNTAKLYDLSLIEELMHGDKDSIKKIVELFVQSIPATVVAMQEASVAKDWATAGKEAHSLKSNIATLKMDSLLDDIKTIEISGKTGSGVEEIPMLVDKAKSIIDETIIQLKQDFNL